MFNRDKATDLRRIIEIEQDVWEFFADRQRRTDNTIGVGRWGIDASVRSAVRELLRNYMKAERWKTFVEEVRRANEDIAKGAK
jgi:type IV pilus biogenesis protein CpaD/CtpE